MFFKHVYDGQKLNETVLGENLQTAETEELICSLMVHQIEFADVIALNKMDLLPESEVESVKKAVQALNSKATIIPCEYGKVRSILYTLHLFCIGFCPSSD